MTQTSLIAKHLREVYFGGNWTSVNFKQTLAGIDWQQATTKVQDLNTIAALVYHTNYYIAGVSKVLEGEALNLKDALSFNHPPIDSAEDWEALLNKTWREAEVFASLIEQLDDDQLPEIFVEDKYGSYHRNFWGIIEHLHYHLGQIVLLKKLLAKH